MTTVTSTAGLQARNVQFNWQQTVQPWVPGDRFTSHFINVLHLLLPEGELWFCRLYNKALPEVSDRQLNADVKGFIRQEAVHSRSHQHVLDQYFSNENINTESYTRRVRWLFSELLGDHPLGIKTSWGWLNRGWLSLRLGIVAAIEHFTCVIGRWILESKGLDRAGADSEMMGLLRWHGAEEVEHRNVAHNLFMAFGGNTFYRGILMLLVAPMILILWMIGTHYLMRNSQSAPQKVRFFTEWRRAARQDRLPSIGFLFKSVLRYFRPSYHPEEEGGTELALAVLERTTVLYAKPSVAASKTAL